MTDFDPLNERVKESFSRMTAGADPGRVTAAVREKIGSEKERNTGDRMRRPKKLTVLLAAVLAVILLTTAAAAAVMAVQARMRAEIPPIEEREGELIRTYQMEIEEPTDPPIIPDEVMAELEALPYPSKEGLFIDDAIAEGCVLVFENWQEAADWLDCGLLVDPMLGPAPFESGRLVLSYYDGVRDDIHQVSLIGMHTYPDTRWHVSVSAVIPLNAASWENYRGGVEVELHGRAQEEEIRTDVMTSPTGDEVTLLATPIDEVPGGDIRYELSAHFIHEGIIYKIDVWTTDREGGEAVVRRVVENMR